MKININNYEAYLLDYFEGNLPEALTDELMLFLGENPQIEVDWEGFDPFKLSAGHTAFEHKQQLYRTESDLMGLAATDVLLVKQLEEGLTVDEKAQLQELLATNPSLEKEVKTMACTRLKPGSELFSAKNSIKRLGMWPLLTLQRARQVAAILVLAILASTLWLVNPVEKKIKTQMVSIEPTPTRPVENIAALKPSKPVLETIVEPETTEAPIRVNRPVPIVVREETPQTPAEETTRQTMEPLKPRRVEIQQPGKKINAYEMGVNHMMPIYVALLQNEKAVKAEPLVAEAPRNISLLEGGIKMLNALSGSDIRLNKELDNTGKVVAYSLQTENTIFNKQVRR